MARCVLLWLAYMCLTQHTNCRLLLYLIRAHLLLTGRTTVEEIFTVFSSDQDLRLCPGDCSCNCSNLSLSFKAFFLAHLLNLSTTRS